MSLGTNKTVGSRRSMLGYQRLSSVGGVALRRHAIQAVLLAFVASGMLLNNVLLFWLFDYPVTLTILLTAILFFLGLGNWLGNRAPLQGSLFLSALALIIYEFIVHGVGTDGVNDSEWIRSFPLLICNAGLLIVSSKFQISKHELPALSKAISYLAYFMGGLGLVQFALANLIEYEWRPLPASLMLRILDPGRDSPRFGGLIRASGISYEFSYYGIGMVVLATLCLTLLHLSPPDQRSRRFRQGALVMALGGTAVSFSLAAWGYLAAILVGWIIGRKKLSLMRQQRNAVLAGVMLFALFVATMWSHVDARLHSGIDRSVNYRLKASIDLILAPGEEGETLSSLVGTGIGLEAKSRRALEVYWEYFPYLDRISLVNGFAYVAVTMGWIGLALNGLIIVAVFRRRGGLPIPTLYLVALVMGYLFASGNYLSPEWWALLAFVAALKGLRLQGNRRSPRASKHKSHLDSVVTLHS